MNSNTAIQSPASSFSELDQISTSSSWLSCGKGSNAISFEGEDDEIVWSLSSSQSSVAPQRREVISSIVFESLDDLTAQGIPLPDGDDFVLIGSKSSGGVSSITAQAMKTGTTIHTITDALAKSSISDSSPPTSRIVWSEECDVILGDNVPDCKKHSKVEAVAPVPASGE